MVTHRRWDSAYVYADWSSIDISAVTSSTDFRPGRPPDWYHLLRDWIRPGERQNSMQTWTAVQIGDFVLHPDMHGVAQVADIEGAAIRLESFESVAHPVAEERWVLGASVIRHALSKQTRVFHRDEWGRWRAGRVISGGPSEYIVRFPNSVTDALIPSNRLRVRWDRPLEDPLQVLVAGGQESPFFRDARMPVVQDLIEQRAACASVPACSAPVPAAMTRRWTWRPATR